MVETVKGLIQNMACSSLPKSKMKLRHFIQSGIFINNYISLVCINSVRELFHNILRKIDQNIIQKIQVPKSQVRLLQCSILFKIYVEYFC